jgi:5-methylcytosine-specific restriction endonuclease McrA
MIGGTESNEEELQSSSSKFKEESELIQKLVNPGKELKNSLKEIFPLDLSRESSFLTEVDNFIKADGDFIRFTYESTINYLLRRIINTSEFLRRRCYLDENDPNPRETFLEKLRLFLREELSIQGHGSDKILIIILRCLDIKSQNRKMNKTRRKKIIKSRIQKAGELFCYICGISLTTEEVEIEHMWPKTMGGAEDDSNLKVSCKYCNEQKQDYIDASDFHYEEICLPQEEREESFTTDFRRLYKIAVWAKGNYGCVLCGAKSESVGRLKFIRRNPEDSWHFLNIDAYCERCLDTSV